MDKFYGGFFKTEEAAKRAIDKRNRDPHYGPAKFRMTAVAVGDKWRILTSDFEAPPPVEKAAPAPARPAAKRPTETAARESLAKNRRDALGLAEKIGGDRVRVHLVAAEEELLVRLKSLDAGMAGTFTEVRMQATLRQIRAVLGNLHPGMKNAIVDTAVEAADAASGGVIDYLEMAERGFQGVGAQALALDEASMLDSARSGAKSSVLRRLMSSGEDVPGAERVPHMAKMGILDRYGANVVGDFEGVLRQGMLTRKPWEEIKAGIIEKSPFLQGKPAFWAERIVRTETMGAYNQASSESLAEAGDQLGDMVKILSATFDDRTAADSYAVHGQIRRTNEAFDTWYGPIMFPPARPNDREVVVPHRISWPIPPFLFPKSRGEVVARWKKERKKGAPPATPLDTTVPRNRFGRTPPPKLSGGEDVAGDDNA